MTRWTARCVALLLALTSLPAFADDALLGAWEMTHINDAEPSPGQGITFDFADETVRVTITSTGVSQTWELAYAVTAEGELTIEPAEGPGEPSPTGATYSITDGTLTLELDTFGVPMTLVRAGAGE